MAKETEQQRIKRIKGERAGYFARLSLLFFKNRRFTAIFMTLLIAFGVLSYTTLLQREGFPSVDIPVSFGSGAYFVDDSDQVDKDVAKPLGEIVRGVEGVEDVTTFADRNFFQVVANLEDGTGNIEGNERIREAIASSDVLPDGVMVEVPDFDATRYLGEYDLLVALYGPLDTDPEVLEAEAKKYAAEFEKDEIVEKAGVESLFSMGIDPRTGKQVTQQTSFNRVGTDDGQGFQFFNATVIGITGASGDELDLFELNDVVEQRIDAIQIENGDQLKLEVAANFTDQINNEISSLQNNVFTGLLVVTIISALMISWRVSILTAVFMVSVIFVTSAILLLLGYSLNTLTLFALVLALGLFVDDATIISESIDANKDKRLKKTEIVKHAINNVGSASFAGTLTTIMVFFPLMFIGGILGSFIFLLPLTVIVALATSLLLSLTLLPFLSHFSILTDKNLGSKGWNNPIPDYLERAINALKTNRKVGIPWAIFAVSLSFIFIMGSGFYFQKLSFNIFPSSKDADELGLIMAFDPGSSIDGVSAIADEVNGVVKDVVGENLRGVVYGGDDLPNT
ncbi:MAG: efflux RND transporter permease subunit, partial [Candidatus Saccharimonadales bacterium]|nr:efflux RND transporter permease subunit [Candidatus Saccharimonadales bacterium]